MIKGFIPIFLVSLFLSFNIFAQGNYIISGAVKDKKEVLPGASVYVSGYKISTITNAEGKFTIPKLLPGNYDILVQMIGYTPYSKNIVISDKSVQITVTLTENTTMLNAVEIKPDPNRPYYISLFKDYFIGRTPNSTQCKILNTEVLSFDDDKKNRLLTISASDFLIVVNEALGYRLKYLLESFEYDYTTKIIYYSGHPYFEELKGSKAKQKKWLKNREIAYKGSVVHFFKSLYDNTVTQQGFVVHKLATIPNTGRLPDSLINANVRRLTSGRQGLINTLTFNGDDSLSYWIRQRGLPKTMTVLNRADVLIDTLVTRYNQNLKMMKFSDALYVIYKNEKEGPTFPSSGHRQNRPPDIGNFQISVLNLRQPTIQFYANGGVFDPRSALLSGYWGYEKVADMLPLDYVK